MCITKSRFSGDGAELVEGGKVELVLVAPPEEVLGKAEASKASKEGFKAKASGLVLVVLGGAVESSEVRTMPTEELEEFQGEGIFVDSIENTLTATPQGATFAPAGLQQTCPLNTST